MTDFANDLRDNFFELNEYIMKTKDIDATAIERNEIMMRLTDLIQFHSDAKELIVIHFYYRNVKLTNVYFVDL